jgi:hypothetical protein
LKLCGAGGGLAKGLFRMKVHGRLLDTIAIDQVSDLVCCDRGPWVYSPPGMSNDWREVTRATNLLGAVEFEDPYLPNMRQRFYRARLVR